MEERKVATVVFADLTGSTELADREDPERTRILLDRFSEAMADEVAAVGGTVEKFAGDAVMAVFGAPAAYEDHAERALHAALSMQRRLETMFEGRLRLHIGVNTGEVIFGAARAGGSFVSGDAVNVAARLEQAASAGEVLVGERTVAAAGEAFEFARPMTIEAKGKPEGILCRRLLQSIALTRPRGVRGLASAFVGRAGELDLLLAAYRAAVARHRPALVTIVGDAGIGKSRLVRELWDRLPEEDPDPARHAGRCLAYGRGITYRPLAEILRAHVGVPESAPPGEVLARLPDRPILGLTLGLDTAGDLHPLAARDALHEAWIGLFDEMVAEGPAVVLIEDLHWAEPPLLDLVEQAARGVNGPLMLVATARPDFVDQRPGWGTGRYDAERIWLEQLPADAAEVMLESLLEGAVPDDVRTRIVERSEGNPLFLEELLGSLIDQGLVERGDGGWRVRDLPADLHIPDTVQAVVAARLDLLPPAEKTALQTASVMGRVFWTGPVYELTYDEPEFRVLEDRDFVRRRRSSLEGDPEYTFKHAITREVAYASMPRARRARLHAAFAEWIERRMGENDELVPLLAHHLFVAVDPEVADLAWTDDAARLDALTRKARRWLRRAGSLAAGRFELEDAIALFEQALRLGPEPSEEVDLWRSIGRAHALRYDGAALAAAMQHAIRLCTDPALLGELNAELAAEAATRSGMWADLPEADLVQEWIDRALELAPAGSAARARALVAVCFWRPERPEWAVLELDELTRRLAEPRLRIQALMAMWLRGFREGRFREALDIALEAMSLAEDLSDPEIRAELREGSVTLFSLCGRTADTERLIAEFDELSERLSPHHRMHGVAMAIELHEITGDLESIRALVPRTRALVAENLATPCVRNSRSLLSCAAACAALGDDTESRALENEADGLAAERAQRILAAPRVRLALARGDLGAARAFVEAPTSDRGSMWWYPAAVTTYLDALAALGDREALERDAPRFLAPPSVLEPFALRALGIVRGDEELLARASESFLAMGLDRQAGSTPPS